MCCGDLWLLHPCSSSPIQGFHSPLHGIWFLNVRWFACRNSRGKGVIKCLSSHQLFLSFWFTTVFLFLTKLHHSLSFIAIALNIVLLKTLSIYFFPPGENATLVKEVVPPPFCPSPYCKSDMVLFVLNLHNWLTLEHSTVIPLSSSLWLVLLQKQCV